MLILSSNLRICLSLTSKNQLVPGGILQSIERDKEKPAKPILKSTSHQLPYLLISDIGSSDMKALGSCWLEGRGASHPQAFIKGAGRSRIVPEHRWIEWRMLLTGLYSPLCISPEALPSAPRWGLFWDVGLSSAKSRKSPQLMGPSHGAQHLCSHTQPRDVNANQASFW